MPLQSGPGAGWSWSVPSSCPATLVTAYYNIKSKYPHQVYLDYMENFLTFSRQLDDIEIEKLEAGKKVKQVKPKLADFDREIQHYENIYENIKKLDKSLVFSSWFKVDVNPLKTTLQMCAKKWSFLFKKHLMDIVVTSLA